jgi:predicted RNase H-like nuclease (RuvC/YqgF family)
MLDVKTKLEKALEALKKEKRKINPSAVEKRAGVANGSLKNHPVLREIVLIEKNKYRQSKSDTAQVVKNRRNAVEKKRYEELEARNNRLKLESSQFKAEMKTMADSIVQLTWELHRYKTATRKDSSNVRKIKK